MATWAATAKRGDPVAISGTGRGHDVDSDSAYLLVGDESALPAITTILEAMPAEASAQVIVEIGHADAELRLVGPAGLTVAWHVLPSEAPPGDALVEAVITTPVAAGTRVWAAGEAASVQRIRKHLFDTLAIPRQQCTVRGYWKHGRAEDSDED
jgi:NADPH-dependent ferric siderophore reductase